MHSHLEAPKPLAIVFGITLTRGYELLSIIVAQILHTSMCPECGEHILEQQAATVILYNGDWYNNTNEREYTMLIWGKLVNNEFYWYAAKDHKHIDYADTLIAIREHLRQQYERLIAPLN